MMKRAIADPSLVWIADTGDTKQKISQQLKRTIEWLTQSKSGGVSIALSELAYTQLAQLNIIPTDGHIRALLQESEVADAITSKELARMLNELILSSFSGTDNDIDYEAEILNCTYDFISISDNPERRDLTKAALLDFALTEVRRKSGKHYVLPRNREGRSTLGFEIRIDCLVEREDEAIEKLEIDTEFDVFAEHWSLIGTFDCEAMWGEASNANDLKFAIISKAARDGLKRDSLLNFRFSDYFLPSARLHGAMTGAIQGVSLMRILDVVSKNSRTKIEPFRVSAQADSAVRRRASDEALARRVHLTTGHEGFRLMFWELPDGTLEFANIGPKFELKIAE